MNAKATRGFPFRIAFRWISHFQSRYQGQCEYTKSFTRERHTHVLCNADSNAKSLQRTSANGSSRRGLERSRAALRKRHAAACRLSRASERRGLWRFRALSGTRRLIDLIDRRLPPQGGTFFGIAPRPSSYFLSRGSASDIFGGIGNMRARARALSDRVSFERRPSLAPGSRFSGLCLRRRQVRL